MLTSAYYKFDSFVDYLAGDVPGQPISIASDVFKIALSNEQPVASDQTYADVTEITSGNGYTLGGAVVALTAFNVDGVEVVMASDTTFTATSGSVGPFQFFIFYDSTPTDQPLICWLDCGSPQTLSRSSAFLVSGYSDPLFTIE